MVAVTFPPTTILLSTTKPVVVFVNWRVLDVVFPLSEAAWRVVDTLVILDSKPPSPKNLVAFTFPTTVSTFDTVSLT